MPYAGRFDPPANPGEEQPFEINFFRQLINGDTIATVVSAVLTVAPGFKDPNVASYVMGTPSISGSVVSVTIEGLVGGVDYILTITITTAQSKRFINWADLPCAAIGS
jgi:hypothetical protein